MQTKKSIDAQSKAILTYNQANRVQNFQIIDSLRLLRSFSSMAMNLNQILQTSILRGIEQNQTTVAQREAYKDLLTTMEDLFNATGILGSGNLKVQAGWKDMISTADSLNSTQLTQMIKNLKALAASGKLSGDDLTYLNTQIKLLEEVLAEQNIEESTKQWNDFFSTLTQAGAAAAQVGLFTLALQKQFDIMGKLSALAGGKGKGFIGPIKPTGVGVPGGMGGAGAIGGAALGINIMEWLLEQMGVEKQSGTVPRTSFKTLDDLTKITQGTSININMYDTSLNSELDLAKLAKQITDLQKQNRTINSLALG